MNAAPRARRLDSPWAALAILSLLCAAVFEGALFRGRVFFERDVLSYWHPMVEAFVRAVGEGGLPLWNPHFAFGLPLAADPNYQAFYPLTWLNLLLPPAAYFTVFAFVHAVGAGLGLVLLLRRRGVAPLAALTGGAAWSASGPLLSAVGLFHHFAGAAWMSWVLLALDVALTRATLGAALALGAVAGGQALAGSADLCLMTALVAAGYATAWLVRGERRARLRALLRVVAVSVPFAFAVAAVQWLPALALLRAGTRLDMGRAASLYWSLHPASLLDLLVPRALAELPLSAAARAALFETREPLLACIYLGAPAALLAALALADRRWRAVSALTAGGAVFFVLLALGRHAPLLPVLLNVPPFGVLRYPPKYLLPAALLWAALVGMGTDAWLRAWAEAARRRATRLAAAVLAVAAVLSIAALVLRFAPAGVALVGRLTPDAASAGPAADALAGRVARSGVLVGVAALLLAARARGRAGRALRLAVPALVAGDLLQAGHDVNDLAPRDLLRHRPPVLDLVGTDGPRVFSVPYPAEWLQERLVRLPHGWTPAWATALGALDRLAPAAAARWGAFGSYDGDFTGLAPAPQSMLSIVVGYGEPTIVSRRLLRMGSIDYVVALRPGTFGLPRAGEYRSVWSEPVRVFRVPDTFPRAYMVGAARAVSAHAPFAAIPDPTFDPSREVLLPREAMPPRAEGQPPFTGSARILGRRTGALELETDSDGAGYVVVTEAWFPGWRAAVDGRPAAVLPANLLFRAVAVPAGRHRVAMWYRPPGLRAGLWLSAAAAAAGLAVALGGRLRLKGAGAGRSMAATVMAGEGVR